MKSKDKPFIPFKTIDYLFGILVLFVSFGVYLHTLTPTIGFHDSGELITVAWTLGIAHPPGYPLYTLLGKVFITLIPFGNIAFRMNMQSALFASLCVMMTYFITLRLTSLIIPSIVASLILAFSLTFWEQAVIAEKYTLNAFFASLIIFILLKWEEGSRLKASGSKLLYLFSFILGLSFTHHFQTIYLVPASVFFILTVSWENRIKAQKQKRGTFILKIKSHVLNLISLPYRMGLSPFIILKMSLLFLLPLFLWTYLPLRASQNPILNWGDPKTLDNFIIHILAKSYTGYFSSIKQSFIRFSSHLNFFPLQFSKYILWISLFSIPFFLKRKILFLFFLLIFIVNSLHSIRYTIVNICDYYIPSFILTSILIGLSLSFVISLFSKFRLSFLKFVFLILPFISYHNHYFQNQRNLFYYAYDYGMNILRPLKKSSIAFSYGDSESFPIWYFSYVEERRKDVVKLILILLPCDWHIESAKRLNPNISFAFEKIPYKDLKYYNLGAVINERLNKIITSNFDRFPIYAGHGVREEKGIRDNFFLLPDGLFFRLLPGDEKRLSEELEKTQIAFLFQGKGFKDRVASNIWSNYSLTYNEIGNLYRRINVDRAIFEYKRALNIDPSYLPSRLNLAFAYIDKKDYKKARDEFGEALKIDKENTLAKKYLDECEKFL
ncbi:MAG: DUF2723 domain-containing protein [bacterium]